MSNTQILCTNQLGLAVAAIVLVTSASLLAGAEAAVRIRPLDARHLAPGCRPRGARLSLDGILLYSRSFAEIDGPGVLPDGRLGVVDDPRAFDQEEAWLAQDTAVVTSAPDWRSSLKLGFTPNQGAAKALGNNLGFSQRLWLARWRNTHELVSSERRDRSLRQTWGGEGRYEADASAGPGPDRQSSVPWSSNSRSIH